MDVPKAPKSKHETRYFNPVPFFVDFYNILDNNRKLAVKLATMEI